MTRTELAVAAEDWQRRLRLQDWDINVEIVPAHVLTLKGGDNWYADISLHSEKRKAFIRMADPKTRKYDWELALVHEMLHIFFGPFGSEDGSPEHMAEEQAVHAVSTALVTLYRESEGNS